MKQISKNSNRHFHNRFFYEDFNTVLAPEMWDVKSDIESLYLSGSPIKETMSSSINVDTGDAYSIFG